MTSYVQLSCMNAAGADVWSTIIEAGVYCLGVSIPAHIVSENESYNVELEHLSSRFFGRVYTESELLTIFHTAADILRPSLPLPDEDLSAVRSEDNEDLGLSSIDEIVSTSDLSAFREENILELPRIDTEMGYRPTWRQLHAYLSEHHHQLVPNWYSLLLHHALRKSGHRYRQKYTSAQRQEFFRQLYHEDPDQVCMAPGLCNGNEDAVIFRAAKHEKHGVAAEFSANVVTLYPYFFGVGLKDSIASTEILPGCTTVASLLVMRPKTMIHEIMHLLGAHDFAYRLHDCFELVAQNKLAEAADNADSLALYVVVKMYTIVYPEYDFSSSDVVRRRSTLLHHFSAFDSLRHRSCVSIQDLPGYDEEKDEAGDYHWWKPDKLEDLIGHIKMVTGEWAAPACGKRNTYVGNK